MNRARDESGVTLVELLVMTALSILVLALSTAFFVQVTQATTRSEDRRDNVAQAANAMNVITQLVRAASRTSTAPGAEAFLDARGERLQFYSFTSGNGISPTPVLVRIAIDNQRRLTVTRWATTSSSSASTTTTYEGYLSPTPNVAAGEAFLFHYFDASGNPIGTPGATLTTAQRAQIARVQVTVTLAATTSTLVDAVTLRSTVGLPNLFLEVAP